MIRTYLCSLLAMSCYIASAQSVPNYIPTDSLQGWYPFNGNANNEYGTGKNGSVLGPALTTDRFGAPNSAFHFDGNNNHITIDTNFFNVGWHNFTISLWENLDTLNNPVANGNSQMVFNTMPHNGVDLTLNWTSTNHYMFFANANPGLVYTWNILNHDTSMATLTTHVWNHLAFVKRNDTSYSFYLNGVLDRVFNRSTTAINYYCKVILGRIDTNYATEAFMGKLDDYGIWNRGLAVCEIRRLYYASPYTYIISQPANVSALVGGITHFTETDTGAGNTYQWQVNSGSGFMNLAGSGPYSGVTTPTLTITSVSSSMNAYKYRCIVSGAQVCVDTSAYALLTIVPSDIASVNSSSVTIAPNPTNGIIDVAGAGAVDIKVYNTVGQLVKEARRTESISLAALPSGIYILKLFDDKDLLLYYSKVTKQ